METSLKRIYREGDRIMLAVVWVLFVASLASATLYGTWGLVFTVGLVLALVSTTLVALRPARRGTRLVNAFIFMAFAALLIQQMHGMIEMHFTIFVLLAFLLFYRDWIVLVAAALVIAVHHLGFHFLQNAGAGVYVFPAPGGIGMVFVHAGFVVFETLLLMYMAVRSRQEALDLSALGSRIGADGTIDLCITRGSAAGGAAQRIEEFLITIGDAVAGTRTVAAGVQAASESLAQVTAQIRSSSEETSAQANVVSTATDQVNRNPHTVATSAEEMSATIQDIAKNSTESARVANEAVKNAETANTTISNLGVSSEEIGKVIKAITSIAQQTNLLALNATIEAARAVEAGKGFAVVANEVKELAKQTAKATEDISQKIAAIQTDTKKAVDSIATIGGIISHLNDFSGMIATAVEEQSATANDMSRNITEAAKGSTEISNNIAGVAQAAQGTSSSAQESMKAAQQLAQMSTQLRGLVEKFKVTDGKHGNGGLKLGVN